MEYKNYLIGIAILLMFILIAPFAIHPRFTGYSVYADGMAIKNYLALILGGLIVITVIAVLIWNAKKQREYSREENSTKRLDGIKEYLKKEKAHDRKHEKHFKKFY